MTTGSVPSALYLQEPGDAQAVEPTDIHQAGTPNCWFLSALAEIAIRDPSYISNTLITDHGNGTESVQLYDGADGQPLDTHLYWYTVNGHLVAPPAQAFSPTTVTVDNSFDGASVNSFGSADVVGGTKEIWPQVVEKAFGENIGGFPDAGGDAGAAFEALTGHQASTQPVDSLTRKQLVRLFSNNALMALGTDSTSDLPYNLVADHEYAVESVDRKGGHLLVSLYNPWGDAQPDPVPFSQLKTVFSIFSHGQL